MNGMGFSQISSYLSSWWDSSKPKLDEDFEVIDREITVQKTSTVANTLSSKKLEAESRSHLYTLLEGLPDEKRIRWICPYPLIARELLDKLVRHGELDRYEYDQSEGMTYTLIRK